MDEEQYKKVLDAMTQYCENIESGKGSIDNSAYLTFCKILDRLPMTQEQIYTQMIERLYG